MSSTNERRRVGIVGCGAVIEQFYAPLLPHIEHIAVTGVCDRDATRAKHVAAALETVAADFDTMITSVDLLIVATPPDSHAQLASRALEQGADVLLEKPFVTRLADARVLCDLAKARRRQLLVAQMRRLYPHVQRARDFWMTGLLGDLVGIEMFEGGRFDWEVQSDYVWRDPFGGVLFDTGPHTLDMALFACGMDRALLAAPRVTKVTRNKSEPSHEIDARFSIAAPSTATIDCRLFLSRLQPLANRVRLIGRHGTMEFGVLLGAPVIVRTATHRSVIAEPTTAITFLEIFRAQLQAVAAGDPGGVLAAPNFVNQIAILEALHQA